MDPEEATLPLETRDPRTTATAAASSRDGVVSPDEVPSHVGGYRIERRLGAGGMGDVYVGYDERLQRRVALKAIRADRRLDQESRDRFLREARVLSSLDHPHICRIHDYLETPGSDFLVLELIDGDDLDRALPNCSRADKLRIAEEIMDVLVTAHAAGVVHRDLKPGNVMLTTSGAVKVLDFGLARHSGDTPDQATAESVTDPEGDATVVASRPPDPAADSAAARSLFLTQRTHMVIGTPMYMSPEQARGEVVTPASDIYSVGLMLQEMFTGRRPYPKGMTVHGLLRDAVEGRTLPVTGLDRDLTRLIEDLESFDPASRPTAVETRERIRWIRDKPRRRARRIAVAATLVLVLLAWGKYTFDVKTERDASIVSRNEAEDLLTFVLGDLKPHLDAVGKTDVLADVADRAQGYYSRQPARDRDDEDRWRLAKTLHIIGQIQMTRGDLTAAETAFQESLLVARDVVDRHPERPEWLMELGASHFYVASLMMERGELGGAFAEFTVYLDIADRLVAIDPDDETYQLERAYGHTNLGGVLEKRCEFDAARRHIVTANEIKRSLLAAAPDDETRLRSLANGLQWLGSIQINVGAAEDARATRGEERALRETLVGRHPLSAQDQSMLSTCLSDLGVLHRDAERYDEALASFDASERILLGLVGRDPENLKWKRDLAVNHRLRANVRRCRREFDDARVDLAAGEAILRTLLIREPEHAGWRLQMALLREQSVMLAVSLEQWSAAVRESESALAVLAPLASGETMTPMVQFRLAQLHMAHGRALRGAGHPAAARAAWTEARRLAEDDVEDCRSSRASLRDELDALLQAEVIDT